MLGYHVQGTGDKRQTRGQQGCERPGMSRPDVAQRGLQCTVPVLSLGHSCLQSPTQRLPGSQAWQANRRSQTKPSAHCTSC